MGLTELIITKRETRQFLPTPVEKKAIDTILEAGRLAGSAKNKQPWIFILIKNKSRLKDLAEYGNSTQPLHGAAFAIIIAIPNEYLQDRFDSGRAAQNMMLTAHALGVGSCPITLHNSEGAKKFLGLPSNLEVQVALAFGNPAHTNRTGKVLRKTLEEILRFESYSSTL